MNASQTQQRNDGKTKSTNVPTSNSNNSDIKLNKSNSVKLFSFPIITVVLSFSI